MESPPSPDKQISCVFVFFAIISTPFHNEGAYNHYLKQKQNLSFRKISNLNRPISFMVPIKKVIQSFPSITNKVPWSRKDCFKYAIPPALLGNSLYTRNLKLITFSGTQINSGSYHPPIFPDCIIDFELAKNKVDRPFYSSIDPIASI